MNRTLLVRRVSAIAVLVALAGCETQPSSEGAAPAPAPATTSAAPVAEATSSPAIDDETAKACAEMKKDLKDNDAKVAKALKIGPPAGHIAVSAQWIAASAAIGAHSIGTNETVSAAADAVREEMRVVSDEYNESAKAKPSMKKLDAAVKELTAACSAS